MYSGQQFSINFAEHLMQMEEATYMVERKPIEFEEYFWSVEDGTERPFVQEIQDVIRKAGGPVLFAVNDIAYKADPTTMSFENLQRDLVTALIRHSRQ